MPALNFKNGLKRRAGDLRLSLYDPVRLSSAPVNFCCFRPALAFVRSELYRFPFVQCPESFALDFRVMREVLRSAGYDKAVSLFIIKPLHFTSHIYSLVGLS